LIVDFEDQLKKRILIKNKVHLAPEKALLDYFKYYDLQNKNMTDFKTFLFLIKNKLGISTFNDDQIKQFYLFYTQGDQLIKYREFISQLYQKSVDLSLSVKSNKVEQEGPSKKQIKEEAESILTFIKYKIKNNVFGSCFILYYELKGNDGNASSARSVDIKMALKKINIDVTNDDMAKIIQIYSSSSTSIGID